MAHQCAAERPEIVQHQVHIAIFYYFLSSAERPGGGSPKTSEVSERGASN